MAAVLFAFVALAVALWALRTRPGVTPGTLARTLGVGAGAMVVTAALESAGLVGHGTPRVVLLSLAAAASLVLWGALAMLAFHQTRRRDLFWLTPFGLLALLDLGTPSSEVGLAVLLSSPWSRAGAGWTA